MPSKRTVNCRYGPQCKNAKTARCSSTPSNTCEPLLHCRQTETRRDMDLVAIRSARCVSRPQPNFHSIGQMAREGYGLVDLWEASPVRLETNTARTAEIIDTLFPGDPLLCCGWSRHCFDTRPKRRWYKSEALQFIVPNPMSAQQGITASGNKSAHSLGNTGPRRFLVIEFDFDSSRSVAETELIAELRNEGRDVPDLCAGLLLHLAERAPLALAVHSGGKSLHGWFYCVGQSEESLKRFMQRAVLLGADTATWTRSQFVRMPDGKRGNGRQQTVYFFNPFVLK